MRPLLAIAGLTVKAAVRFRVFAVLAVLLALVVVGLPLVVKDDGTARGFAQILLTYTLSLITVLLGFATLWIACGSLAREVEECQMQMLDVKPIARWQVWLGKWLGLLALNALLLALSAGTVFGMLLWRANHLPTAPVNQRAILFNEVLVARGSAKPVPPNIDAGVEKLMERVDRQKTSAELNEVALRQQFREQVLAQHQLLPPQFLRRWVINLGVTKEALRDQVLFLRVHFFSAQQTGTGTYPIAIDVGPLDQPRTRLAVNRLAAEAFHELQIPASVLDANGQLVVDCINQGEMTMLFPLEDGVEVLYRAGGFTSNYVRGLLIILCWLGLLGALGLAAASGLSFPVAAFVALVALLMALSSSTVSGVVERGTLLEGHHDEQSGKGWVDLVALPMFKATLQVIRFAEAFSPIDSLSSGRAIPWSELGAAFLRIIVVLCGGLTALGIYVLNRRELATAQGKS